MRDASDESQSASFYSDLLDNRFRTGGVAVHFWAKKNIKWIKICSVIYFGFGVLGMALLFVWGTSLLGFVLAQQKMICNEIIPSNEKIREENKKLKNEIKLLERSQKIQDIKNPKQQIYIRGTPYKMFPNTERENSFEYIATNNQVVIVRFHGLGMESHVSIPEKIQGMPVVRLGKMSFSRAIQKIDAKTSDNLVKLTLPGTLEYIEGGAFQMNSNLSEVNLPPKISVIEDSTFAFCGFTNLVFPNTVQKIGKGAFMANANLKSVNIPASVEFIGKGAFSGCRNLTNIEILGSNTVIDAEAFQYCPRQPANPQSSTNPQQNP